MTICFSAILLTGVIFFALILNLVLKKKFTANILTFSIVFASIGGLFIYGYGYSLSADNLPLAVLRSLISVFGMFMGKNDYSVVSGTPLFHSTLSRFFFWLVHMMAQYATVSAIIAAIGAGALRRFRLWLPCFGDLSLIYGVNENSVSFGRCLAEQKGHNLVFIDEKPSDGLANAIISFGGVLISDKNALWPDSAFLKSLGIRSGKRHITVYALCRDSAKNTAYSFALLDALKEREISAKQTSLVMIGAEDGSGPLQAYKDHYGFGSVTVFDEAAMAARILIRKYPPCNVLSFDKTGRALRDFDALIIGFGKMGQAVMKQLIMNGQFSGSDFHLGIFAPDAKQVTGYLYTCSPAVFDHYNIEFFDNDGRSREMYRYLRDRKDSLNYVVVCTGNEKVNREISGELVQFFKQEGNKTPVFECSYDGVRRVDSRNLSVRRWQIYTPDVLCTQEMDRKAVMLNHRFCADNGKTPEENWVSCDSFRRMSSRASADFMTSILKISASASAGSGNSQDPEQNPELMENLGITEHLRWCAFHYVMGYEPMPEDVFEARCEQYLTETESNGSSSLRITEDPAQRQHACLIDWDELDALSERLNQVTGGSVDYRQTAISNVRMAFQLSGDSSRQQKRSS